MAEESGGGRVVPLDDLGRGSLAEGEQDVSGWQVLAADGTHIGKVERVLVDADAGRVRYLDVGVESHLSPGREQRHVLLPMSQARLGPEGETVVLRRLRGEDIRNLPPYKDEPVSREYDTELADRIGDRFRARPVEEQGFLGPQVDVDPDAAR